MPQFETKTVPVAEGSESEISRLGQEGWRLVSVDSGRAFLQRELPAPVLEEPKKELLTERAVCLNCASFSRGAVNKKTGLIGGFCQANQWSTHHLETCQKFERKSVDERAPASRS